MNDHRAIWNPLRTGVILTGVILAGMMLTACSGKTFSLFGDNELENAQVAGDSGMAQAPDSQGEMSHPRGDASVPLPGQVAVKEHIAGIDQAIAGEKATLDTRIYDDSASRVFSSVVDALTALNMPIQRVNSSSGLITTDWIWQNANTVNVALSNGRMQTVRYRFFVRLARRPSSGKVQLEIRTLGQTRIDKEWVTGPLKRKVSEELFSAVEEQLARHGPKKMGQGAVIRP